MRKYFVLVATAFNLRKQLAPIHGELVRREKARRKCWPKEKQPTRGAAEAQMRSIMRRELAKDKTRIHVYYCPYCHTWHVGHTGRVE